MQVDSSVDHVARTVAMPIRVIKPQGEDDIKKLCAVVGYHSPYIRNTMLVKLIPITTAVTIRFIPQMAILTFSKSLKFEPWDPKPCLHSKGHEQGCTGKSRVAEHLRTRVK